MSGTTPPQYQVRYRPTGTSAWTLAMPTTDLHETLTALDPGQYDVEVLSITTGGVVASDLVTFTLASVLPSAPGDPVISAIAQTSAVVNWPQSSAGTQPISYQLWLSAAGGAAQPVGLASTQTSAALTGLAPATAYAVYVTAANDVGAAPSPSSTVPFSTPDVAVLPTIWQASVAIRGAAAVSAPVAAKRIPASGAIVGRGAVAAAAVVLAESAQGAVISTTAGVIYDATLNAWTLLTSTGSGLQVAENGTLQATTANVVQLLYWNHTLYYQDASWHSWTGAAWIAAPGDPRVVESADGTVVTDTAHQIGDATGAIWTLSPQSVSVMSNGRDPAMQPYASGDFWNVGIGSGAQWTTPADPATATLIAQPGMINSTGNYNIPHFLGVASDPLILLHTTDTSVFPCADQHVHIPLGSAPAGPPGGDQHMTFFDRTQPGKLWSLYFCVLDHADGNGGVSLATTTITCGSMTVYDATGSGVYAYGLSAFPAVGTGNVGEDNYAAGTIRDWEISAGVIPHALRFTLPNGVLASPGNYFNVGIPWPNVIEDFCGPNKAFTGCSSTWYTGNIPYGKTVGIPASVNLAALGLSTGGMMIAKALQTYGATIRDAGSGAFTLYTENLSAGNQAIVNNQMIPDMAKIVPQLRIMTNQSANGLSNINGGGTYPPTAAPIEASQGATLASTAGFIIDSHGDRWSLVSGTGLQIYHAGALDGGTTNTILLLYWNRTIYRQTSAGAWLLWTGSAWQAVSGDPRTGVTSMVFDDEFTSLSLHEAWQAGDNWAFCLTSDPEGRGGLTEGTDGWYTNPYNPNTLISGIYTLASNELVLSLLNTPPANQAYIDAQAGVHLPFVGGMLNSQATCLRTFGYFEFSAAIDRVPGFGFRWIAENWPVDSVWPPEINLIVGTDQSNVQHVAWTVDGALGVYGRYDTSSSAGFDARGQHIYGVDWQVDFITCYIDGAQVLRIATPTGVYTNYRMYMILETTANDYGLPVGLGDPSAAALPANAHIDYVRVWPVKPA